MYILVYSLLIAPLEAITGVLPRYTFDLKSSPTTARETFTNGDWYLHGNGIASKNCFMLSTSSPDRGTILFHKYPIVSNDLTIEFAIDVKGTTTQPLEQGFAFWYSHRNLTETDDWENLFLKDKDRMMTPGWSNHVSRLAGRRLFMNSAQFDGIGVILSPTLQNSAGVKIISPTITLVSNDGRDFKTQFEEVPIEGTSKQFQFRNAGELVIKLILTQTSAEIWAQTNPNSKTDHTLMAKIDNRNAPPDGRGYIGFSAATGHPIGNPPEMPDMVRITKLSVRNNDASKAGQDPQMPPLKTTTLTTTVSTGTPAPGEDDFDEVTGRAVGDGGHRGDKIHERSLHKDEREGTRALKTLSETILQLVFETEPQRQNLRKMISNIEKRVGFMETTLNKLKTEINASTGQDLDAKYDVIRQELMDLTRLSEVEGNERRTKINKLQHTVKTIHKDGEKKLDKEMQELHERNQEILDSIDSGHQGGLIMACIACMLILIAGIILYQKFASWEKRHIL